MSKVKVPPVIAADHPPFCPGQTSSVKPSWKVPEMDRRPPLGRAVRRQKGLDRSSSRSRVPTRARRRIQTTNGPSPISWGMDDGTFRRSTIGFFCWTVSGTGTMRWLTSLRSKTNVEPQAGIANMRQKRIRRALSALPGTKGPRVHSSRLFSKRDRFLPTVS
jgi:hypothetical protein